MLRIGIDIGGTFTDFVVFDPSACKITTFKLITDAANPATTVLHGLQQLSSTESLQIIHGSTVATNALLERKGARTALVTTRGFKDVLQIGRQNRPSLYDWNVQPPAPLVPTQLRLEVDERVDYQGHVELPLDPAQLEGITNTLASNQVESVAICLLFSFLHPEHEQLIAGRLRQAGYLISSSSEILPEFREFERTSTTVVNAYVSPILDRYLSLLEPAMPSARWQVMQSNGGMISLDESRRNGARCILSGPAGGIVAAQNIAHAIFTGQVEDESEPQVKLITFDMGGTSTDVSLVNGQPSLTTESSVGGCPIRLPLLDIHTIGAGGGSIAYVDAGGSLRVGPTSAGADPGPACYGKGELPTVTDANLVLGRLLPGYFLGGKMPIYPDRAFKALSALGTSLGMDPQIAARGVIEVVNAQMEHALRVISVERGHDPRDFSLFSFGGAGGLHASELARRMAIPRLIIPRYASTLSAYGMLASNVVKDYVKTVMLPASLPAQALDQLFAPLLAQGKSEVSGEGIEPGQIDLFPSLDVRFTGQSYELNVPYTPLFIADFHAIHRMTYGYTYEDKPIEIVNLRLRVEGKIESIQPPKIESQHGGTLPEPMEYKQVELASGAATLPVHDYDRLLAGTRLTGPALIVSSDTTSLGAPGDRVLVDGYQNLIIDVNLDRS